jgi:antitoxin (DNA-binding transcriptional repressor) of toxin-antitoxin stability system
MGRTSAHPTIDPDAARCHCYTMATSISIKQLHQTTGEHVRLAARSRSPIEVTDRGKPVAVLARPALLAPKRRRRTLLAEYKALLSRKTSGKVLDDLDAVRGER